MGLDVFVISRLKKTGAASAEIVVSQSQEHNKGIEAGYYRPTDESIRFGFRVGPYSFYNRFRETLSLCMHGVEPVEIWNSVDEYSGRPFVEMIDFSDCDGKLGGQVCHKLHADFEENRSLFKKYIDSQGWSEEQIEYHLSTYEDFTKAFEIGRDEGVVIFC